MKKQDSAEPKRLGNIRHSLAHLLAAAVMRLYPDAKRTIGPAIENGFYFDFEFKNPVSEADLQKIEAKMREMLPTWDGFAKRLLSARDAKKEYPGNPYKHELIDEFSEKGKKKVSFYKSGEYWDLCRGGHVASMKQIDPKSFTLDRVAGAYWRGSEKNKMLTRIYGLAFGTKKELDQYLAMRREAERRDHRKLGQDLGIFMFDDLVGKGLPLWLPKGAVIRDEIERFAIRMEDEYGYVRVFTPHIAKEELFLTSGHLPYYKDSMYPPMEMDDGTYYLKAMNCPAHHVIFRSRPRSYRELPLRMAEYGTVYRNELSGALAGLLRVRMLSMNDAHMYCAKDQIEDEIKSVIDLTLRYFKVFGLTDYWFRLSLWDPKHKEKYINEPKNWTYTEGVLRKVLKASGAKFVEAKDEAAFYGPKIDVQFRSVIGREESMSTIQLDFAAKKRFGLTYTDKSGKVNNEVFVIHRAPLSTHERFMAFLLEHFAGAFPVWLAPVQVRILPVGEKFSKYGSRILEKIREAGVRAELSDVHETLGKRIREADLGKIPYALVLGEREEKAASVSVRRYGKAEPNAVHIDKFIERVKIEIKERRLG